MSFPITAKYFVLGRIKLKIASHNQASRKTFSAKILRRKKIENSIPSILKFEIIVYIMNRTGNFKYLFT